MVKLTKIYTRTGDDGTTGLSDFSRVRKTDTRIEAYADVDEANSALGLAISQITDEFDSETRALLERIQNELFDVGADLATPLRDNYEYTPIRIEQSMIDALEQAIDQLNSKLDKLDSFILPGGSSLAASLHLTRTVVRRAERATWHAIDTVGNINLLTAKYLNRLSDLLFVLARVANLNHGGDVKWLPHTRR
ncbi:MAG: cob(I)yrinic acid a,c-diamide adenosyltransferase [Actinomycetales bacterium]|nr:cob(I)yrinic acid a,c-diamide adenosyltransferase [Actinomycetales bacterium]